MHYLALVSHDDECDCVPIGVYETAWAAKTACEKHAIDNGHVINPELSWEERGHSRMPGEFWTIEDIHHGERFRWYVRPLDLSVVLSESSP